MPCGHRPASLTAWLVGIVTLADFGVAHGETRELFSGESFELAAESLQPGDTLILHAGDYVDSGRISITVRGTSASPVLIKGADGEALPHITRAASAAAQNTINIEGASYLTLSRLEISSNGGDGVNLNSDPQFITLEQLEIHDVDVGVNFRSSMNNIVVRHSQIYRTGGGDGTGTGEGMYVGCNDGACVVRDSLIENNWIHDTRNSTQGDGIEVKLGSHSNVVRDNVIYNTGFPCILVYGTQGNPVNIVEGNVMWQCGDSGIQAAADAIIRNNIILDSPGSSSFNSQPHQGAVPGNLQFVHNTIVGGDPCVRISSWNGQPGLVFANNAIYCDADNFVISGLAGVAVSGNVIAPATSAFPASGYRTGQARALDLLDVAGKNVYPTAGSRLLDAGNPTYGASIDFNGWTRSGTPDAGAYEWSGAANPGWIVTPGFKVTGTSAPAAPTIVLTADPQSVAGGGSTTLAWMTTNAMSCAASGGLSGWAGSKATQGSQSIGPVLAAATFGLACTGPGGTTQRSVTVSIVAPPTVRLTASASTVAPNTNVTLQWSSVNADACVASNGWGGNKAPSGSESVGPLSSSTTFTLQCTGPGGSASDQATIDVTAGGSGAPTQGGGPMDLLLLALLIDRCRQRLRLCSDQGYPWIC